MTFSPRPLSKLAMPATLAPFALAVVLLGLVSSGCEDKHIGRVCSLDIADAGPTMMTGNTSAIQGQAVECPTRICLLPAGTLMPNTGPLCSATCSSDDDCSDGETTSNMASAQCKHGFACLVATTVGAFCCEKLCVCKDFIDTTIPGYNATPDSCKPASGQTCPNVH
jgi:hypothetical protein